MHRGDASLGLGWAGRALRISAVLCAAAFLASCSGESLHEGDFDVSDVVRKSERESAVAQQTLDLKVELPDDVKLSEVSVVGTQTLTLRDRVTLTKSATSNRLLLSVGLDAKVGDLRGARAIQLKDRAKVTGNVTAGTTLTKGPGVIITGTSATNVAATLAEVAWQRKAPLASLGPITLNSEERRFLEPGTYGNLTVRSRAKLTLTSGIYVFQNVLIEAQGELSLDSRLGPVQLFAKGTFTYRGNVASLGVEMPQFIVGYLGTTPARVEAPFTGALIAPHADVQFQAALPEGHRAFILGKNVTLDADTKILPYPVNWVSLVGPTQYEEPPDNTPTYTMPRAPVNIRVTSTTDDVGSGGAGHGGSSGGGPGHGTGGSGASDGSGASGNSGGGVAGSSGPGVQTATQTVDHPVSFNLPQKYPVVAGTLANGTVDFKFRNGNGPEVTCVFRGGSSSAFPVTQEEMNKGRTMDFVSCSDGLGVNARRTATQFTLTVNPAPDYQVSIAPPMIKDGGCGELIELISPARTYEEVQGFDWSRATKLPENSQGRPALYYAWIYVKSEKDLLALRQLYIHVLKRPLFRHQVSELDDRCGTMMNPGDGTGAFLQVLIPGATYNKLIDAFTSTEIEGERQVFDAVILQQIPAEVRTPQNSIDLNKLALAGVRYLGYEPDPFRAPSEITEDAGVVKLFADAVAWIAAATQDFASGIGRLLNELGKAVGGRSILTVHIRAQNRDPGFDPGGGAARPLYRAWGGFANTPLGAEGMQVTILQNLGFIPSESYGNTDMTGRAEIAVARQGGVRGHGLCVEFTTPAAMITDFLADSSACDFREWDPTTGFYLPNSTSLNAAQTQVDTTLQIMMDHSRLNTLYQSDDAYQYSKHVMGFRPKRARILAGSGGSFFMLFSQGAPFVPCLNYGNSFSDAATMTASLTAMGYGSALGPVGAALGGMAASFAASMIFNTDIVLPEGTYLDESRVGATHEYGHYLFCSMMMERNDAAVDHVVWSTMFGGGSWDRPIRYINEGFADFIAGQVTGGANYPWPSLRTDANQLLAPGFTNGGDAFAYSYMCRAPFSDEPAGLSWCFDINLKGTRSTRDSANGLEPGTEGIGWVATLLHDAFDGNPESGTGAMVPTNADYWAHESRTRVPKLRRNASGGIYHDPEGNTECEQAVDSGGRPQFGTGGVPICATELVNGPLVYSPIPFGNTDGHIERIALPGQAMLAIAGRLADGLDPILAFTEHVEESVTLTDEKLIRAIDETLVEYGYGSWCDRCRLFGLHSKNPSRSSDESNPRNLLEACRVDFGGGGRRWIQGEPPASLDRLDAVNCVRCAPGYSADERGNCVEQVCPPDVTLQGSALSATTYSFDTTAVTPGDPCPEQFIVRVEDFQNLPLASNQDTLVTVHPLEFETPEGCMQIYGLERVLSLGGVRSEQNYQAAPIYDSCANLPEGDLCVGERCRGMLEVKTAPAQADVAEFRVHAIAGHYFWFKIPEDLR